MYGLHGKAVLLTGAAGHLGSAIAGALASNGVRLHLVGRRASALEEVRARFDEASRNACRVHEVDLSDRDALAAFVDSAAERVGPLHGVVNNAYNGRVGPVSALAPADFDAASALNLIAPFVLAQGLAPLLRAGAEASGAASAIVNVASMYGKVSPDPRAYADPASTNPAHYGATKAGLIQLTRYLACNLDPAWIRVNSVSPGPFPRDPDPELAQALAGRVPMGRLGRAEEVAGPVLFLLSEQSSFISGVDLAVDGGWTAW